MAAEVAQPPARPERLSAEDFETASIRSAAPSYVSEAPSYHSTVPHTESVPVYTTRSSSTTTTPRTSTPIVSETSTFTPGAGLPQRIPSPRRIGQQIPQLSEFRIPTWSSMNSNPNARHYRNVAHRRVSAIANNNNNMQLEGALRSVLGKLTEDEDRNRLRPLEDPYLVGEEAASRARKNRLARENGDEILIREDRRWDWFLAQMKDWDERDRSWSQFRREVESGRRGKLARRIGRHH